jgi:2-polyprenyl-3-methyl-5-hydroxy-6-metoxy-1,4-benzoquinol methylase
MTPLSNSFLSRAQLKEVEPYYPLHARVCHKCFLVQVDEVETPERIFSDYAYFSSYSESWLRHARMYAETMVGRFALTPKSQVVEIASNDGYLLQFFSKQKIPVLGIEPAANVARVAEQKGIPTLTKFFGAQTARDLREAGTGADLLLGNNVLAHVPNLNDFVAGLKILLRPNGIITMEFPHLMKLVAETQFDTIYHEHFSYFSFLTVEEVFSRHGLSLFDVEELPTHGGSLRIFAQHAESTTWKLTARVEELKQHEIEAGARQLETFQTFGQKVKNTKQALLDFLREAKRGGKSVVGYGAPAKGNTLLNYCGIGTDLIDYTVDLNPHKQGYFLPGSHIPIYSPEMIDKTLPDYVMILPWNLQDEIMSQLQRVREWGARFVVPIPEAVVI